MPTTIRGPKVLKGGIVTVSNSGQPSLIAFQYNPNTVKRSLKPQLSGGETGDRSQEVRLIGAPIETVSVEIELDATDGLEAGDPTTLQSGIRPQLAALELLIFPSSAQVQSDASKLSSGMIEIAPAAAPRLLFVWGPKQVQPVQIQSMSISEEAFSTELNPIRAKISLEMRVLTYSDLAMGTSEYNQYMAYQQALEALALTAPSDDRAVLGGIQIAQASPSKSGLGGAISSAVSLADNVLSSIL